MINLNLNRKENWNSNGLPVPYISKIEPETPSTFVEHFQLPGDSASPFFVLKLSSVLQMCWQM